MTHTGTTAPAAATGFAGHGTLPNIRVITSQANPLIKDIRTLHDRKGRRESGLFLVEGLRHVREGLAHGWAMTHLIHETSLAGKAELRPVRHACLEAGGLVLEVSESVLEKLARKDNPQQVLGVFRQRHMPLAQLLEAATTHPLGLRGLVALEQVRDPGNLGTIMRTIDGVGAQGLILIDQCCDPYSVECTRASMGSLFAVPFAQVPFVEFKAFMATWTGSAIGTALADHAVDYRQITAQKPVLLVMGNEQSGLTETLMAACPQLAKLPMRGGADSLNLAVATGVMLYKALEG